MAQYLRLDSWLIQTTVRDCHENKWDKSIAVSRCLFARVGKRYYNKSDRVMTSDAFWRSARVLFSEWSIKWHSVMFAVLFCSNSARKYHFSDIKLVCDGQTDGRTHPLKKMRRRVKEKQKINWDIPVKLRKLGRK